MAEFFPLQYANEPAQVLELLSLPPERLATLKIGTARVPKGQWVPASGHSTHDQHEVSLVLKGSLLLETTGDARDVGPGEVTLIPAGQSHRSQAKEDSEIFWVLFGDSDDPS